MAATTADGDELRLASHFPLVHKSCKKPAAKFFDCFSEKANQPPEGVRDHLRNSATSYFVFTCTLLRAHQGLASEHRQQQPAATYWME